MAFPLVVSLVVLATWICPSPATSCPLGYEDELRCVTPRPTFVDDPRVRMNLGAPGELLYQPAPWLTGLAVLRKIRSPEGGDETYFEPWPAPRAAVLSTMHTGEDVRVYLERNGKALGAGASLALGSVSAGDGPRVYDDIRPPPRGDRVFEQRFAGGVRCYECRVAIEINGTSLPPVRGAFATNAASLVTAPRYTAAEARAAFVRQHVGRMKLSMADPELRIFLGHDRIARLAWVIYHYDWVCADWILSAAEIDPDTHVWIRDIDAGVGSNDSQDHSDVPPDAR